MRVAVVDWAIVTGADAVDVRPFLRRRKDKKLLADAAVLAIPAAARALGPVSGQGVGLFLGVGREPPEDATEAAIVASERDGQLDVGKLGSVGMALYPPLASLRTLPNLVLAHVAIQLGLTGEGATRAGDGAASLLAVAEAAWAIHEGRCERALAGGADSMVHPAQRRDLARRGMDSSAGEAAAIFHLISEAEASRSGRPVRAWITGVSGRIGSPCASSLPHHQTLGRCGAADGALALAAAMLASSAGRVCIQDETGAIGEVCWVAPELELGR